MPTAITSPLGHAVNFTGFALAVGNGGSPEVFTPIANIEDFSLPTITVMVETTNSSDQWVSRQPTIGDMGKITLKGFWQMQETSHYNGANIGTVAHGLRYLMLQRLLTNFQAQYPNAGASVDEWPGYVTGFSITSKVKDVFHFSLEVTNSGAPVLC